MEEPNPINPQYGGIGLTDEGAQSLINVAYKNNQIDADEKKYLEDLLKEE